MSQEKQKLCRRGHPRNEENTRWKRRAGRLTPVCLVCKRAWERISRGSDIPPEAPPLTPAQRVHKATDPYWREKKQRPTSSAEKLWEVYQRQQNGNPKRATCRWGHPRTKENTICRWTCSPAGARYVRADCRMCASYQTMQSERRRGLAPDVLRVIFDGDRPEMMHPKERERERIGRALRTYWAERKARSSKYSPLMYMLPP